MRERIGRRKSGWRGEAGGSRCEKRGVRESGRLVRSRYEFSGRVWLRSKIS